MKTKAGGACSKRRRSERLQRLDRISNLPDAILGEIIYLLPTKEGARTRILSSKWRDLWLSAPLNLSSRGLVKSPDKLAGVVSYILSSHPGPGRRFCVDAYYKGSTTTVDEWLSSDALHNLQELYLRYNLREHDLTYDFRWRPPLSASIGGFSRTLRVVTIKTCHLPDDTIQGIQFPLLQQLTLEHVSISQCSLDHMINASPALECLLINRTFGFRCVRINSLTLRTIAVGVTHYYSTDSIKFGELIIENAPCLKRLLYRKLNNDLHVSVISAPKLETLNLFSDPSTKILFGSMVIQGLHVDNLTTAVRSIKTLAVDKGSHNLHLVIDLMRCFPCLDKLYIQSTGSGLCNSWSRKHKNWTRLLDIRLRTLVLEKYSGTKSEVSFVTFFLLNARELETVLLRVSARNNYEEFLASQRNKLQIENKVSRAKLSFTTATSFHHAWSIMESENIDLADPFTVEN